MAIDRDIARYRMLLHHTKPATTAHPGAANGDFMTQATNPTNSTGSENTTLEKRPPCCLETALRATSCHAAIWAR